MGMRNLFGEHACQATQRQAVLSATLLYEVGVLPYAVWKAMPLSTTWSNVSMPISRIIRLTLNQMPVDGTCPALRRYQAADNPATVDNAIDRT